MPNANEETTEFGITSQRNSITAITSSVEPCQPSIPNSSASASQQLSVSPDENLIESDSELNIKDDLPFSFVPGKKVSTSQKRKALATGMAAEQSLFVSQLKKWMMQSTFALKIAKRRIVKICYFVKPRLNDSTFRPINFFECWIDKRGGVQTTQHFIQHFVRDC